MSTQEQIRDIVKSELYNHEFRKTLGLIYGDSTLHLKKDLTQFCELKIENEVTKKIIYQREDIFKTLRDIANNDPIIIKNIANISSDFLKTFTAHCNAEILKAKASIDSHLRSEVRLISSMPPHEHVYKQFQEDNKREIESFKSQTNWVIGSMALINVSLLVYICKN